MVFRPFKQYSSKAPPHIPLLARKSGASQSLAFRWVHRLPPVRFENGAAVPPKASPGVGPRIVTFLSNVTILGLTPFSCYVQYSLSSLLFDSRVSQASRAGSP